MLLQALSLSTFRIYILTLTSSLNRTGVSLVMLSVTVRLRGAFSTPIINRMPPISSYVNSMIIISLRVAELE